MNQSHLTQSQQQRISYKSIIYATGHIYVLDIAVVRILI